MKLSIPVYVHQLTRKGNEPDEYRVRLLFNRNPAARNAPDASGEILGRVMNRFVQRLRTWLDGLGAQNRQDDLAAIGFSPDISEHLLKTEIELRRHRVPLRCLLVSFRTHGHLDRRIAFSPSLPDLWFTVERNDDVDRRARDVFTNYFRKEERDDSGLRPEVHSLLGNAWVTTVELDVNPRHTFKVEKPEKLAGIGEFKVEGGDRELQKVGRCLNWMWPDELDRAILREPELAALEQHLTGADRRPVLLVGPRQVGKTAIVHEHVWRATDRRTSSWSSRNNVWLLAPQRLIAGMKYVGQWESRLLAIITTARKNDHVLYFDDLPGLYRAGRTSHEPHSVGDVLRPVIERREVRVLGEITPDALRVLRETDRALADQFHVIPVSEPPERDVLRVLIGVMRRLENQHGCRFEPDALPTVVDLQRRYVRELAFPGKAAAFMQRLAIAHRNAVIGRDRVLEGFSQSTGLMLPFIDNRRRMTREHIRLNIAEHVVSQDDAVGAMADAVSVARARLNDIGRPMASFLFLGPTGTGKTQCARALATWLFGSDEKLLRFDMNEYVSPLAAARLIGTLDEPEGLLTAAVRRQPFGVLLFDEIEKAHPDVHDMLLQVLGEGRLTDALGRTSDFSGMLIILTSNLGTREAEGRLGITPETGTDLREVYVRAAERFFRPEFYNRLDRVVPFGRLDRDAVGKIANGLIQDVLQREGLVRRRVVLQVDPAAMEHIVDAGFHPALGARALKRAIERQLARPVAERVAATTPDRPMLLRVLPTADGGVAARVDVLDDAPALPHSVSSVARQHVRASVLLPHIRDAVHAVEREVEALRPEGTVSAENVDPSHDHYFSVREQARQLHERLDEIAESLEPSRGLAVGRPTVSGMARRNRRTRRGTTYQLTASEMPGYMQGLQAAREVGEFLDDLTAKASELDDDETPAGLLQSLIRDLAVLHLIAGSDPHGPSTVALVFETIGAVSGGASVVPHLVAGAIAQMDVHVERMTAEHQTDSLAAIVFHGSHAPTLAALECGTWLVVTSDRVELTVVSRMDLPADFSGRPTEVLEMRQRERQQQAAALINGSAGVDSLDAIPPVIRIFDRRRTLMDLRTGMMLRSGVPSPEQTRELMVAALPLPPGLPDAGAAADADHDG